MQSTRWFLAAGLLMAACRVEAPASESALQYVTTAHQLGPVGYRDPIGVISPDGEWLAYSIQAHVYLQRISGGPVTELPDTDGPVVFLAWSPDSRRVVMDRRGRSPRWWAYDHLSGAYGPLWPGGFSVSSLSNSATKSVATDELRQLAFAPDGHQVAGVVLRERGSELWSFKLPGDSARVVASDRTLSFPAWAPDGRIGCLAFDLRRQTVSLPCGKASSDTSAPEAYGGIAFAADGSQLYTATPNSAGTVDLWSRSLASGPARLLTRFSRDAYAPSVTRDGAVLFKVQTYRTVVAEVPAAGGPVSALATFQSETPSWDPTGKWIGITYGTWRRVIDDFHYPDIAQDVGIIPADSTGPADRPARIVDSSVSEDQSLCWSPNGKWIAYHSHQQDGDDIWLVPADGSAPARRITAFGRGFETGWPRWSPDGKWLAFDADSRDPGPRRSLVYLMGVDQETGVVTKPENSVPLGGYPGEGLHAEWLPRSDRLVVHGFEDPDRHSILVVPRAGGPAREVHRWRSEHRFSGIGVSPDGAWVAFPAPADGFFQLFRVPVSGGRPEQLSFDPSNKTQPAYSPDGRRIALTVWEYQVQFWMLKP